MKPYGNLSGNSGVSAYEYGDDWISVQFKKGLPYKYQAPKIDTEHISTMKRLADSGKGLGAYINKNPDVKNGWSSRS